MGLLFLHMISSGQITEGFSKPIQLKEAANYFQEARIVCRINMLDVSEWMCFVDQ